MAQKPAPQWRRPASGLHLQAARQAVPHQFLHLHFSLSYRPSTPPHTLRDGGGGASWGLISPTFPTSPEEVVGKLVGGPFPNDKVRPIVALFVPLLDPSQGPLDVQTARQFPGLRFERVLTAGRRATGSMLCLAQGSMGACIMDAITLVVFVVSIVSIVLAGRIAERRGRSFKIWAWIAAFIGPLALPLVLLSRICTAGTATMPRGADGA
jgi:hypothetical protein